MQTETVFQLVMFALATLYTPGPNNIMLASSGARFGMRRTVPHILGVALGFAAMVFLVALGLGTVFERFVEVRTILRYVGAAAMLYIAWRIGTAGRSETDGAGRPFSFSLAAMFQWINPKAWSIAIAVAGGYVLGVSPVQEAALCAGVFALLGLGSGALWAVAGQQISRFLSTEGRFRMFNAAMGLMVAACALLLLVE